MDKNKIIEAAAKLVAKGAYDKAIKEYQRILDVDPKDVRVLQKMGELYQKKNDNAQAAVFFTRVAESYSGDGFFLKAVALYKQVLKLNPNLADVNIKLAELHQQLGLMSEAMAYYQLVANHYDKAGDAKSSLGTLKKMVDLDPENIASRIKIAELYAREGMSKEAISEFRRAAEYLKRNNRSDDYLRVAERLSALEPENVGLARELAGSYLSKGDQKRALAKLQVCFKADPRDIETLTLLAQAFQGLGQTSKTLSVYKELAKVYTDKGQTTEASQIWAKVQQLDPNDPDVMARRGGSPAPAPAARTSAPATRTSAAPKAVGNAPPAPAPRTPPGAATDQLTKLLTETDVYVKYGLHDKALEHLRKVFSIDPESLDAHEKAYNIYVNAGNQAQAAEQLLNVLRLCTRQRELQRAQPYLATILQQNPRHPEVPAFLAVLRSGGAPAPAAASSVEVADDDAILVDSSDEEIIVADAPEDALTRVAAEDLALISAAPPDADEIVADDDLVMGDPDAPSVEIDEPLMQGEPAEEAQVVEEDVAIEADVLPDDEEEEQPTRLMTLPPPGALPQDEEEEQPTRLMTISPELRTAAIGGPPAEQRPPTAAAHGAVTLARYKPPPPPARPAPAPAPATKDVTVKAPVPAQPRPAPVAAAKPAPERPSPPSPAPPPPRTPVKPKEAPASEELDEAGFFLDQGQLEAAREVLETVLIAYPDHARAREMMGRLEDLEAQASSSASVQVTSDEPQAEAEEARDAFDLAAELAGDLDDVGATDPAADAVGDDFQYSVEEVFSEFKKGLQKVVKPEDVDTHYDLGIAYKEMGLIDDAVGEFTVARQGSVGKKKELDCLTMIGLLQAMKGDHTAAVSSYHEALGSEHAVGETAKALEFELGSVLEAMGDAGRALYHFQRVAKADPKYRDVSDILARLSPIATPVEDPPRRPGGSRGAGRAGANGRKVGYV